jgi:chemotaxis protein methyltransferase CheR
MESFMAWMLASAGMDASGYRSPAMKRRMAACLRELRVASVDAAREQLERRPALLSSAMNAALIGVTEFFRDPAVFYALAATILPTLLERRKNPVVCGVGVSSGQEMYSLAMLLAEAGGIERTELTGIDCRPDAVRRAAEGVYSTEEMRGVSPARRARFFRPAGDGWVISPLIKKHLQWRVDDVMTPGMEPTADLILFRNVAIYFTDERSDAVWRRLCGWLAPGGYIVTGKAERPPVDLPLRRENPSIYRRFE